MTNITSIASHPSSERPLRADAERNRRRILDAARELFAQRGLEATLNDVAHHAGVGVGTVYRRFADKNELVDSLFAEDFEEMVARAEATLEDPDPWHGLVVLLTQTVEAHAADKALKDLFVATPDGMARIAKVRDRMLPIGAELITRARAAGQLRDDVDVTDLAVAQLMVGSVLDATRDLDPEIWRRYLGLLLRGMAAPSVAVTLDAPPLGSEQVDRVLSRYKTARRD